MPSSDPAPIALPDGKRLPTITEALIPLLAVGLLLCVGYGLLGIRIEVLLILAAALAAGLGMRLGYSYQEMEDGVNRCIFKSMSALLIIIIVGAMIGAWIVCGSIPMIIHYGLQMISPGYFLVTACLVCTVVSFVTGTSWGTVGTVGIALMAISQGMGIPMALAAGAIIGGSYFGDKISPLSDTTNLAPGVVGSNVYDHIRHMLWTTVPANVIGLVVYLLLGRSHGGAATDPRVDELSRAILQNFTVEGWAALLLLIPPLITLTAAVLQKPVIPSMLASCLAAWVLAVALQGEPPIPHPMADNALTPASPLQLAAWPYLYPLFVMVKGYHADSGLPDLDKLLNQGGMMAMMETLLIALCAFAFAGIMQRTLVLDVILTHILRFARTTGRLVAATAFSVIMTALVTGSTFLAILLPGELFAKAYRERGLAAKNLSRTTEDCGTVVVPLIPWSISGVYMAGILGVPVTTYAPWAFGCYLAAVFAVIYGFTGFAIAPRLRENETQPGS